MEWTFQDEQSSTWQKLKAYLNDRITMHRSALEAVNCPKDKEDIYRGQIFEDRKLLELEGVKK